LTTQIHNGSPNVKSGVIEKIGTIGAVLAAAACPACFPMLAVVGTALGLGFFRPFEGWVFIAFQILVVIALLGNLLSFVRHRRAFPLIIGLAGPLLIFFSLYVRFNQILLYLGLIGLAASSILNYMANRQ
jgi:mercuric ion transport protein